jgi:beta-galactosidase
MQVEVYSRCERVELFLNGRSLGAKPTTAAQRLQASFEAPYEPGELRAVGFDGRRRVFETVLATAGAPAAIRLTPDRAALRAGEGDLCYVTVEVTDALGRFHPAAGHEIRFSADGAGRLLAVGSADPVSAEPYVGNRRRVFRGRCLAVLLPGREPGEIRLTAEADGLRTAEILVRVAPFTDAACTRTAIPSTPRP